MRVLLLGRGYLSGVLQRDLDRDFDLTVSSRSSGDYRVDLLNPESLINLRGFDTVIHLSSPTAAESAKDPDFANRYHSEGTRNLLDAMIEQGVRKLIYLSTFHVYGMSASNIQEDSPKLAKHPYALSHLLGEEVIRKENRVNSLILRLSNSFGAPGEYQGDFANLVLNDVTKQAVCHGKIVLKGDGSDKRDFLCLSDFSLVVRYFLKQNSGWNNTYNVASGTTSTVNEMLELLQTVLGKHVQIERGPAGTKSPEFVVDISKLTSAGFTPGNDFRSELSRLVNYFQRIKN